MKSVRLTAEALPDDALQRRKHAAEQEVIRWGVAVAKRPNADHVVHDARLRAAVEEYENACEAIVETCDHADAEPVSAPVPGATEMYCSHCDTFFLRDDPKDKGGS